MILRIIVTFCLFAGLAYYFNIDVRQVVEESGVPTWLEAHGIGTAAPTGTTSTRNDTLILCDASQISRIMDVVVSHVSGHDTSTGVEQYPI